MLANYTIQTCLCLKIGWPWWLMSIGLNETKDAWSLHSQYYIHNGNKILVRSLTLGVRLAFFKILVKCMINIFLTNMVYDLKTFKGLVNIIGLMSKGFVNERLKNVWKFAKLYTYSSLKDIVYWILLENMCRLHEHIYFDDYGKHNCFGSQNVIFLLPLEIMVQAWRPCNHWEPQKGKCHWFFYEPTMFF